MHSRELAMTLLLAMGGCPQSAKVDTVPSDPQRVYATTSDPRIAEQTAPVEPAPVKAAPVEAAPVEAAPVEHCRARVCPRWTGAASVNTAARVRSRKAQ